MKRILLTFSLLITAMNLFAQGGTTCAGAVAITTNGNYSIGALTSGTYPTGTGLCFTTAAAVPNARWYRFTPTSSGLITVTSDIVANSVNADTRLSILTGACAAPWTCRGFNDDVSEATSNFRSKVENIAVVAGTTYYIVWDDRWDSGNYTFDFTFVAQSCFVPTGFIFLAAPTETTATIGWTAPNSGTAPVGYEFQYGLRGFTLGSGTTVTPTTNNVALTGLTGSSVYSFYVRSNCGGGDFSVWAGPINFNTVFSASSLPYSTSFEDTSFPFIGWLAATPVAGGAWLFNAAGTGDPTVQNGTTSIFSVSSSTVTSDSSVISRGVNLTGGQAVTVSFYASNFLAAPAVTATASYEVNYGNTQALVSQTNLIGSETGFASTPFVQKSFNFTPATTGIYYISLKNTSPANTEGGTHALLIDSFSIAPALSVEDFISSKFSVSPNPVQSILSISNAENINVNAISIADLNGRIIKEAKYSNVSNLNVDLSELSSGMYIMNINSDQGVATKKIVKE